jgi:tartrate-resistant acid phosphatase type 5
MISAFPRAWRLWLALRAAPLTPPPNHPSASSLPSPPTPTASRGDIRAQLEWKGDERWNAGLNFERSWELPPRRPGGRAPCLSAVFTDTTPLIGYYRTPEQRAKHPTLAANAGGADRAGTVAWTAAAVAAAAAACDAAIVFGHHPLYSPGEHSNSGELIAAYDELLERAGVDAYVAGHDHILAHSRAAGGGVEHVLTGAGSEVRPKLVPAAETRWVATRRGFTVHSVNATHQAVSYVWADGEAGATQQGLPGRVAFHVVKPLRIKPRAGGAGA